MEDLQKIHISFVTRIFRNWRPSPRESDASGAKSVKHGLEFTALSSKESKRRALRLSTGVEWTRVIIRLPDDGTGALPIIRHIILKDSKILDIQTCLTTGARPDR